MSEGTARRTYTQEFKIEAVRLSSQPDVFVSHVARDLDVRVKDLYRWRAEIKDAPAQAFPGKGRRRTRDDEVERLQRELEQVKMEREILKKATAFFAGPCLRGTHS